MTDRRLDHPELIAGPNPLFEALAPFVSMKDLPAALRNEPLAKLDWRSQLPEKREAFLVHSDQHYWPIAPHVYVAGEIQLMLRSGLVQRNPMSQDEQRRINMLALAGNANEIICQSPKRRACGSILSAITGLGKSTFVERALSVLAPRQILEHRANKACGWSKLMQVAYLLVNAPSSAARKGLFTAIIGAMDELIGSKYSEDLRRQKSIEESMVFVHKVLSVHRVGLLVIDENQASTLAESIWGYEFVQYYLGLLNLGIPVLLVGNPLAFSELSSTAQLLRRFATNGWHELSPAKKADKNCWWHKEFLPGAIRFALCEAVPSLEEIQSATSDMDGGIPAIFLAIWKEGQKIALRRGGETARLTAKDLEVAASSPSVKKLLDISRAVLDGNTKAEFLDLPQRPKAAGKAGNGSAMNVDAKGRADALRRIANQVKRQESREKNKEGRKKALQEKLSEDDLRRGADALSLLAGEQDDQGELEV